MITSLLLTPCLVLVALTLVLVILGRKALRSRNRIGTDGGTGFRCCFWAAL